MSSGHHDVAAEKRRYLLVFAALAVGTIITVAVSKIHFGSHNANIAVGLAIALVKGFLVAGYFMHLISERIMIYTILVATVFFFAGLMYLTLWSLQPRSLMHDPALVKEREAMVAPAHGHAPAPAPAHH